MFLSAKLMPVHSVELAAHGAQDSNLAAAGDIAISFTHSLITAQDAEVLIAFYIASPEARPAYPRTKELRKYRVPSPNCVTCKSRKL